MKTGPIFAVRILVVSIVLFFVSIGMAGQTRVFQAPTDLPNGDVVNTFISSVKAKDFSVPKTPWGDPDINGVFTTKDEANTPLERPKEWTGRRMQDIKPQELAQAIVARQQQAIERAPFAGGGNDLVETGVAIAVPIHWFDNLASMNSRPWFVIEPSDGEVPPLAADAKAHRRNYPGFLSPERDSYTDRSTTDRCIGGSMWWIPNLYGNSHEIYQTPDTVVFRYESFRTSRIIRLNQRHLPQVTRPLLGDSIGWWEGDTLVIETTNFPDGVGYRGYTAKDLRVIERLTRTGLKTVEWSMTFDNPKVWTKAWTYSMPMTLDATQPIFEYACHEGNFGLANILSAGRAEDKKVGAK